MAYSHERNPIAVESLTESNEEKYLLAIKSVDTYGSGDDLETYTNWETFKIEKVTDSDGVESWQFNWDGYLFSRYW